MKPIKVESTPPWEDEGESKPLRAKRRGQRAVVQTKNKEEEKTIMTVKASKKVETKSKPVAKPEKTAKKGVEKKPISSSPRILKGVEMAPVGKTTGLKIQQAWVHIFQKNAKAKRADRLTDAQITKWLRAEYNGRPTAAFDHVQAIRNKYNRGGLTKKVVPEIQSVPYDENGNAFTPQRGRPTGAKTAPEVAQKAKKEIATKKGIPVAKKAKEEPAPAPKKEGSKLIARRKVRVA